MKALASTGNTSALIYQMNDLAVILGTIISEGGAEEVSDLQGPTAN